MYMVMKSTNSEKCSSIGFNSLPVSNTLMTKSRQLIIFANSLDPDQVQHNARPYLDPNCLIFCDGIPETIF